MDTDFGGDKETRRSVSSAVIMMLGNPVMTYARQQTIVSTSSCEAETNGLASGLAEALGMRSLRLELKQNYSICIRSDSIAARALTMRSGLGRCKHLDIKLLWIQEVATRPYVKIKPVTSQDNLADLGTKFLERGRHVKLREATHLHDVQQEMEIHMIMRDEEQNYYMNVDGEERHDIEEKKKHEDLEWWVPVIVVLAIIGFMTIVRRGLDLCCRRHQKARPGRAARPAQLYPGATPKKRGKAVIEDIGWRSR